MKALVEDARAKGARVETVLPDGTGALKGRRFPPTVLFETTPAMKVSQEEIFGPLLPVRTFERVDEAIDAINEGDRPLAFYYFDDNDRRASDVLKRVPSGGACINDTLLQFVQDELPFGGLGKSGMGAYHGAAGFEAFSHARGVLVASGLAPARKLMSPPYSGLLDRALQVVIRGFRLRR
jgi:coniferyl-aldehyde dehydrogenase